MLRLAFAVFFLSAPVSRADEDTSVKVEYTRHTGHFEKNNAGLKDEPSLLLIADQKRFDAIFGSAFTMGAKPNVVPNGAFEKKIVAAVIHRGNAVWTYEVEKVTVQGGTLTIRYKATEGKASTAKFASPLIVSVDKGAIKKVMFVENGKDIGSATPEK
ncbi:MAG: hypothetical protein U0791_10685 [Gemmataceae bacterium]